MCVFASPPNKNGRILGANSTTLQAPILRNLNRYQWSITMVHHAADPALTTRSTDWYIWEVREIHPLQGTSYPSY